MSTSPASAASAAPHVVDATPCAEFAVDGAGNLLVRGQPCIAHGSTITRDDIARIVAAMNGAGAAPAHVTSESDVVAWMERQVRAMDMPDAEIILANSKYMKGEPPRFILSSGGTSDTTSHRSFFEALALHRAKLNNPAQQAAEKRAAAAKLVSEAELLEESADERAAIDRERDEPDYDAPKPLTALENWQRNDEHKVS